jgi:hypothetical protein
MFKQGVIIPMCLHTAEESIMDKLTKEDYMKALEEANEPDQIDKEENPDLSEAERLAHMADAPRKRVDGAVITSERYRALTAQQHAFVMGVIQGKTLRQSYRDAYPNDTSADNVISTNATKLFKHPRVQEMLKDAWETITENLVDDVAGTKRYVLKQLLELSKKAKQEGSQLKALELLGKASGLFTHTDSKAEVTISSEQLKRELAGHLRLVRQRPSAVQPLGTITDVNAKTPTAV